MDYKEVKLTCEPNNEAINNILSALLGEIGYDSFVEHENGTLAYVVSNLYDEKQLIQVIEDFPLDTHITYEVKDIADQNWNEEWEKNYFSPIVLEDKCVIKSSFHKDVPDAEYTIIINPKMAFGTGHHQTTILMLQEILKRDFTGLSVLDMGCGTAILAILASMRGAKTITAIDIDQWACDNALENLELNTINNVSVKIGGADLLGNEKFDVVIANINRNILLADMHSYANVLNEGGTLYISGFYTEDRDVLKTEALKHNLSFDYTTDRDNWAGIKFVKLAR